jgi:hypothetical protein
MMRLWHSFQEGRWAMYLIFALGLPGVGAAGRFAWRGEHQLVAFLRWVSFTLLASGAFGFFIGWQRVLQAVVFGLDEAAPVGGVLSDRRLHPSGGASPKPRPLGPHTPRGERLSSRA